MAYLLPFKFENYDMLDGIYIDSNKNLICKIKTQSYDRLVIEKSDIADDSEKIILEYNDKDKKIEKIIENFLDSSDKIIPINDKLTIAEIKTIFASKKLRILEGQRLYDNILEKKEEFFIAYLKAFHEDI